jgi:thiol-disulfide isomerase/thioredoxin
MKYLILLVVVILLGTAILVKLERAELKPAPEAQPAPKAPEQPAPSTPEKGPRFMEKYEDAIARTEGKVLFVFGAEWCQYCVSLKKYLKASAPDGCVVCVVDVDDHKHLKSMYSVRTLPTSIIVERGKEVSRKVGFSKDDYGAWLNRSLKERSPK